MTYAELMADAGAPVVEHIAATKRRARKQHRCADCGKVIEPGETYYRHVVLVDGDIDVAKSHTPVGACLYNDE